MSALRRLIVTLLVVSALAAGGWYGWRAWDEHDGIQTTSDAYVKGEITVLSPRVAGYAVEVLADDDVPVHAGQVLVRLDPRDYRAAVESARAKLAQEEALRLQAGQRLDLQQQQILVAQSAFESAQAQDRNASIALARARDLLARGSGTQMSFDNATAADASAQAGLGQARAQLAYQKQQIGVLQADIDVAKTRIDDAQAQLDTARIALEDTAVWAPIAGVVANRRTRVGEYVTIGTSMLSIVPRDGLWIEADFRETQLARMHVGDPTAITLDTYGNRRLCGYVEAIGAASNSEFALLPADNATGNFTKIVRRFSVRIRPNASDANQRLLKPGMSTSVAVAVDGTEVEGCRFDRARDRQSSTLPKLPAHAGLHSDATDDPPGKN